MRIIDGIYQLLTMTESIAQLAVARASRDEIEREAITAGMKTLWDDGLAKVAAGITDDDPVQQAVSKLRACCIACPAARPANNCWRIWRHSAMSLSPPCIWNWNRPGTCPTPC